MDKNKSIDGLTIRRSNPTAKSSTPAAKPTKSIQRPAVKTTKSTKPSKAQTPKSASKTTQKSAPKTSPKSASVKKSHRPNPAKHPSNIANKKPNHSPAPTSEHNTPVSPNQPVTPVESPTDTTLTTVEDFLSPTQVFNFDETTGELKASDTPVDPHGKHSDKDLKGKKVKKPVSKKRKIITSIILIIVILIIAGVVWLVVWGNDIIAKITGGQGNIFDLITFTEPTYEPLKTDANGRTNILAFGTSGYNMEGDEGDGTHDGAQLTDSIMVISLNQETGDVAMLSLPRDLKASPTCTATGKINEVYWCNNMDGNNEQAGAEALMTEVGDILGIDFQYYAHLNWGSLVSIVDILGGITVTLDEGIYDYYYTEAVFEPNTPYTIDGAQALGLARARHGTEGGDFSRGASQQKILIGIKDKVLASSLSITDLLSLAGTLGDNLRTNFSVEELKTMAHLAVDLDFNSVRQISLIEPEALMTTGTINGISYVLPSDGVGNYARIRIYVTEMLSNDPRVYEDYTILVLNGTETPGLAGAEKQSLISEEYANITVDDAPEGEYTNEYTLYSLTNTAPGTKKLLEEKYGTAHPAEELPANIPQDYDFILILGSTPTTQAAE